jgi:hypothetical protein
MLVVILIHVASLFSLYVTYNFDEPDPSQHTKVAWYLPSMFMNLLIVTAIIFFIIKNKIYGTGTTIFAIFLMVGGIVAETYMSSLYYQMPEEIGTYFLIVFNYLVRMYYSIELRTILTSDFISAAKNLTIIPASSPGESKSSSGDSKKSDSGMVAEWDKVWKAIGDKNSRMLTDDSIKRAKEIVRNAASSGKSKSDAFRDAKNALRRDDGATVVFGGRRSR